MPKNQCACGGVKDIRAEMCQQCKKNSYQDGETKFCTGCQLDLPIDEFHFRTKRGERKRRSRCQTCERKSSTQWIHDNKEHVRKRKRRDYHASPRAKLEKFRSVWKKRGYDGMAIQKFREEHNRACDICGRTPEEVDHTNTNLSVDHDHTTGRIRGMLCSDCNAGLGLFKDNPELLFKAIEYLKSNKIQIYPVLT